MLRPFYLFLMIEAGLSDMRKLSAASTTAVIPTAAIDCID